MFFKVQSSLPSLQSPCCSAMIRWLQTTVFPPLGTDLADGEGIRAGSTRWSRASTSTCMYKCKLKYKSNTLVERIQTLEKTEYLTLRAHSFSHILMKASHELRILDILLLARSQWTIHRQSKASLFSWQTKHFITTYWCGNSFSGIQYLWNTQYSGLQG